MEREQKDDSEKPFIPSHQRKLLILSIFATFLIFLFWIWTLPINFQEKEESDSAKRFFERIGTTIEQARNR